jgi:hypothetical protein
MICPICGKLMYRRTTGYICSCGKRIDDTPRKVETVYDCEEDGNHIDSLMQCGFCEGYYMQSSTSEHVGGKCMEGMYD